MNYTVIQIISQALGEDLFAVLPENINPSMLTKWDSVLHLMIIVSLEDEFDVVFEPEEIEEALGGLDSIVSILERKGK